MSVNVNTVYTRVLAIMNKEQRGYVTPQEFNIFANQAQMDIFEQYFYDLNQFLRLPGNDTGHSDMVSMLHEKIAIFNKSKAAVDLSINSNKITLTVNDLYRLTAIYVSGVQCDRVSKKESKDILLSPLTIPTADRPMYYVEQGGFYVYTASTPLSADTDVVVDYIKQPAEPNWSFSTVGGAAIHNSSASTNFELHESEEVELVLKILELAGVATKQIDIAQYAGQKDTQGVQQEKM